MYSSSQNGSIYELQSFLFDISRIDPEIPRVNPDGIYGKTTEEAVIAFQRKYGLRQSGRVDFTTWRLLLKRSKEALELTSPPLSILPFQSQIEGGEIMIGDRSEIVYIIKMMLRTVGSSYPLGEDISRNDLYDEETEGAVMDFQAINGILQTGRVDTVTWNRLATAYNKYLEPN